MFDFRSAASAPWLLSSVPPVLPVVIAVALFGVLGALFGRRGREDSADSVSSLRSRRRDLHSRRFWLRPVPGLVRGNIPRSLARRGPRDLGLEARGRASARDFRAGDFSRRPRVLPRRRILDFDRRSGHRATSLTTSSPRTASFTTAISKSRTTMEPRTTGPSTRERSSPVSPRGRAIPSTASGFPSSSLRASPLSASWEFSRPRHCSRLSF